MKYFFSFFVFFLIANKIYSQNKIVSQITGHVLDSISGAPIEFATVSFLNAESKIIAGGATDNQGVFHLKINEPGTYQLNVYFVGYKFHVVKNIVINQDTYKQDLGKILLSMVQQQLQEVEVITEKQLIENKIDKVVYNAEKDLTAQSGSAIDLLKKIPQISVDVNGNVDLQGNSNIRFLINGKPSAMFGNNFADVLKAIPVNLIQSIEVISIPGAKYDAEGGGIINIILKKSNAKGYNGNLALTAGNRLENAALNLSARNNHFGVNAFFSGNAQLLTTTMNSLDRISTDAVTQHISKLHQHGQSDFKRSAMQGGLSAEWNINAKNTITVAFNYNYMHNRTAGMMSRQMSLFDANGALSSNEIYSIISSNVNSVTSIDYSMDFKKTFKQEGQELELFFVSSQADNKIFYTQSQNTINSGNIINGNEGNNPGMDKQINLAINYIQPIKKLMTLETGVKLVTNTIAGTANVYLFNNNTNDYVFNVPQSNRFNYNLSIYAGYLSVTGKLFKLIDVKAGCRFENTQTSAKNTQVEQINIAPYNTLVPSIAFSNTWKESQTLKLSYARRISRPGYRDVNPFINAADPKNITAGNVNLVPEFSDNFECAYSKIFNKGNSLNVMAFFRGNYQDIQPYSRYYDQLLIGDSSYRNVSVSTRENIGTEYNTGLTLSPNVHFSKVFSLRGNLSTFYRVIKSIYTDRSINGWMYRINLTASFQINKTVAAEMFGNFNSPRINAQGVQPTFTTYNLAIRKLLFHNNGSIAFTATNPFDKYVNQKTTLNGTNFNTISLLQLPYRSFGFNFTYKFGKMEFKKQKELEDANLTNPTAPGNGN